MQEKTRKKLRVIPLGGLGEVGKNMNLFEWDKKILIVDVGLKMPNETMPGVDYIIPNIDYLKGKEKDILGIVFTHGHYDHIGALPYLIEKMGNPPIYASPLTKGIIIKRQEEFPHQPKLDITDISAESKIELGPFKLEFFHQNHNITDNLGIFIQTPVGNIIHTSDFKFDDTPVNDKPTDYTRIKELASKGVLLLMIDSTAAESEGHSLSEKVILENLDEIFKNSKGRIIAATFSSLITRIQNIIQLSEKYGRRVAIEGTGMKTNIEIARRLKHIKIKKGTLAKTKDLLEYPDHKMTVICTGAQGEGKAALMRIATKEHRFLQLSDNSAHSYFNKFRAALKQAVKDGIIRFNPAEQVDCLPQGDSERAFLTLEELQSILKHECEIPILKTSFIFSCLTGLRWSDINKLVWSEVQHSNDYGWYIRFRQKKTKGAETLPMSDQARDLLNEIGEPEERVFKGLKYSAWHNLKLQQWIMKAGISKTITFHCARHTYATLQLTLGTDIFTVSKLLGHKDIRTTQVYAKIIDEKKMEAANKIKLDF